MLSLNISHWLKSLKRAQPIWRYELLAENESSRLATAKRTQASDYSVIKILLRKVHIKALCGTLLLGLVAGIILVLNQHEPASVIEDYAPRPWEGFIR